MLQCLPLHHVVSYLERTYENIYNFTKQIWLSHTKSRKSTFLTIWTDKKRTPESLVLMIPCLQRWVPWHRPSPRVAKGGRMWMWVFSWPILVGSQAVLKLFCWDLSWILMKFSPFLPRFLFKQKGVLFSKNEGSKNGSTTNTKGIELMRKLRWRTRGRKVCRLGDHNPVEMGSLQLVPPNNRLPQTPMVLHNVHSQNDHKWRIIIMDDSTLCKHTVTHPMSIRLSSNSIPVLDG